jgi:hypothetical protein
VDCLIKPFLYVDDALGSGWFTRHNEDLSFMSWFSKKNYKNVFNYFSS